MSPSYNTVTRLFGEGKFVELIEVSGPTARDRSSLELPKRVLVANALALVGELTEAKSLAQIGHLPSATPRVRSQAEWTLALVDWRGGEVEAALRHSQAAIKFALESDDIELTAWAHLHLFRLLIDVGPMDAIVATLPDVRRLVNHAGNPRITAYLHNCVAVLEGQTGRLDEASRHLDIAVSLLQLAPNEWLTASLEVHRGSVACAQCNFATGAEHFRQARELSKKGRYQQIAAALENSVGYVDFLHGDLERAKRTVSAIIGNPQMSTVMKLCAADTLARLHLALGELDFCDTALSQVESNVRDRPELALHYHARWAAIPRARLFLKRGQYDQALACLRTAREQARQLVDIPLQAITHIVEAQTLTLGGDSGAAALHLCSADYLRATCTRDLQAQYYYGCALIVEGHAKSLSQHLKRRALRLWQEQNIVSIKREMDYSEANADGVECPAKASASTVDCITDSLAAFSDLAHRPRLLGEEMVTVIEALHCSPRAVLVESRTAAAPAAPRDQTATLPLGPERQQHLTLVCRIPDDPAKAVLLANVLRMGRSALELERAREDDRRRAALWPAPPIEEQAGALFLAEEMQTHLATARRVAPTTVPVLITGETGTGKEVLARTIHAYSSRAAAAFLPFNCSGVPKDMLDSQLFGHRRGAFTGASEHFPGVIRAASGGTLFLDEIGDTTLEVQPKLLRFLESNEIHPIGEARPVRSDVRVIAATNADLDGLVAQGRFREDLFYRLNIIRLHLPPLRERRVEIAPLANHYLYKYAREYGKGRLRLAEETMEYLLLYRWPGNVRQLANEMRRLAALAETDAVLMPEHLSPDLAASRRTLPPSERVLDPTELVVRIDQPMAAAVQHLERAMILHAMRVTGGRMEETASTLGLSRKGLYLKRVRYGLEAPGPAADVA